MKTLEQKRDELKAQLKEIKKQIKEQKPVDGFYTSIQNGIFFGLLINGKFQFGFNGGGIKFDSYSSLMRDCYNKEFHRLDTPEEVTKRLTEFVNGLGYVKGTKVKPLYIDGCSILGDNKISFIKGEEEYFILYGGLDIWSSIKGWAKIIEDPKYKVEPFRTFGVNILKNGKDLDDSEREQLAKEIETFLNSKSETFTTK